MDEPADSAADPRVIKQMEKMRRVLHQIERRRVDLAAFPESFIKIEAQAQKGKKSSQIIQPFISQAENMANNHGIAIGFGITLAYYHRQRPGFIPIKNVYVIVQPGEDTRIIEKRFEEPGDAIGEQRLLEELDKRIVLIKGNPILVFICAECTAFLTDKNIQLKSSPSVAVLPSYVSGYTATSDFALTVSNRFGIPAVAINPVSHQSLLGKTAFVEDGQHKNILGGSNEIILIIETSSRAEMRGGARWQEEPSNGLKRLTRSVLNHKTLTKRLRDRLLAGLAEVKDKLERTELFKASQRLRELIAENGGELREFDVRHILRNRLLRLAIAMEEASVPARLIEWISDPKIGGEKFSQSRKEALDRLLTELYGIAFEEVIAEFFESHNGKNATRNHGNTTK
jgi:hypothetical protein